MTCIVVKDFQLPAGAAAERFAAQIQPLAFREDLSEISATRAREFAARGELTIDFVPETVAELIENRGIYRERQKKIYKN